MRRSIGRSSSCVVLVEPACVDADRGGSGRLQAGEVQSGEQGGRQARSGGVRERRDAVNAGVPREAQTDEAQLITTPPHMKVSELAARWATGFPYTDVNTCSRATDLPKATFVGSCAPSQEVFDHLPKKGNSILSRSQEYARLQVVQPGVPA